MRIRTPVLLVACILALSLAALGAGVPATQESPPQISQAKQPTTQAALPSTQPVGYSILGQITAGTSLDLQPLDLTRAVVYLESDPVLDSFPISADRPYVAQYHKAFTPRFLAIPRGTSVEFPNWDHIAHNVFSRSAAAPAFDLDRYGYGESKTREFDKVGVVQLFCNIHPSMRAIIFVTPNIFFTRADKDGRFRIDGVPSGHYQISVWQERCQTQHQSVDVGAPGGGEISFTIGEDHDSILANDPPRRSNYGIENGLGVKQERLNLPVVNGVHPAPTTEPALASN